MNRRRLLALAAAAAAPALAVASLSLVAGCETTKGMKDRHAHEKMAEEGVRVEKKGEKVAVAQVRPAPATTTQPAGGRASGTITFTQTPDGKVRVAGELSGLTANTTHGFHIHEKGDLSAPDFTSAGGHYNPEGHPHAGPDQPQRHAGDFGNVQSDAGGNARVDLTVDNISLGGPKNDVVGKAVIVHAKRDDLKTQPTGDAGARIGGGVIEMKK